MGGDKKKGAAKKTAKKKATKSSTKKPAKKKTAAKKKATGKKTRAAPSKKKAGSLASFVKGLRKPKKKPKEGEEAPPESPDVFLCTEPIPSDTRTVTTRSPLFNLFLSERADGGIPLGRIIEIYADHDQGKTSLLTEMMIAFQQAGGLVMFHDSDFKFHRERAVMRGWLPERTIYLPELSIEGVLGQAEDTILKLRKESGFKEVPVMFAWDSAPSTPLRGNLPGEKQTKGGMMEAARVMWDRLSRRMVGFLSMNDVTLVATSPQIANIQQGKFAGKGPKKTTALGGAIKTQATLRIKLWRGGLFKWVKTDPAGKAVGIYISMAATKHHYRLYAEQQVSLSYMFDRGFHPYYDTFNYLALTGAKLDGTDHKIVAEGGGRYKIMGTDRSLYYRDVGPYLEANEALYKRMVGAMECHYLTGFVNAWNIEDVELNDGEMVEAG